MEMAARMSMRSPARGPDDGLHDRALARLPFELLATVSNRITNEVPGSTASLRHSGKPPATIE
jgi:GMP synthase PP-ATPase subunit